MISDLDVLYAVPLVNHGYLVNELPYLLTHDAKSINSGRRWNVLGYRRIEVVDYKVMQFAKTNNDFRIYF